MATTWIKALHISKTMTKSSAVAAIIDYAQNPQKTDNGRLITSYACDSRSVDDEFMLAKREYEYVTGRNQGRRDVIAYHIRQAFKPGEITPEEANKIGCELAMSFTKGRHAFVVCTHIDKAHVHNHIIFNSTSIDYGRKFKDFFFSGRAVRRISDLLCAEHGLSVIKNPKPSKGSYADWLGDNKTPTWKDLLKQKIDEVLPACTTFEDFISTLRASGYSVKDNRKHISVCAPGQKKPTRLDTLKGDYTEAAIRARLGKERIITSGMAHILVVEDDKSINELIVRNLKLVGHSHCQAFNGIDAVKIASDSSVDLILLDVMLPGMDGFEVIQNIPPTPVIFITAKEGLEHRLNGLSLGADDYIVKPFEMLELLARIEVVLRRTQKNNTVFSLDSVVIDLTGRIAKVGGTEVELSPREFELLEVLIKNRNIALSRDKLLELAWGYDYTGETRTVDTHIQKIRSKLGWENRIKTLYKLGYRLEV